MFRRYDHLCKYDFVPRDIGALDVHRQEGNIVEIKSETIIISVRPRATCQRIGGRYLADNMQVQSQSEYSGLLELPQCV